MDIDGMDTKINTRDAASMLRKATKGNMKPYDKTVIDLNNAKVDEWKERVLDQIAVDGCIDASIVWASWQHFEEGHAIIQMMRLMKEGNLPAPDPTQVDYWRTYLSKCSLDDLHSLGSGTVSMVWSTLTNYVRFWYANEKYKRIFSKSDSPLEWEKLRTKEHGLVTGQEYHLWDKEEHEEIAEKVKSVLMNQVAVEGISGIRG